MLFNFMEEIWKDIIGYEGLYQISNLGQVKSLERYILIGKVNFKTSKVHIKEKILKITEYIQGYTYVVLSKGPIAKKFKIHRLMGLYFIPNPLNLPQINHINAIRNDNRIENLEWCTHSHNMRHKFILGNQSNARGKNACARKVVCTETGVKFNCIIDAAEYLGMSKYTLYDMLKGRIKNTSTLVYDTPGTMG